MSLAQAPGPRLSRSFLGRIGVRLIVIHALILIAAFGVAAYLGRLTTVELADRTIQKRVLGEIASLDDEVAQKGFDRLIHTVDKRTHLWRGFEYCLAAADGQVLAGNLPRGTPSQWTKITGAPEAAADQSLIYTKQLANGWLLSVGQDVSLETRQLAVLTNTLLWCGALGIAAGFAASYLFAASSWRRISTLAAAAREAAQWRLDVRVPTHAGRNSDDIDDLAGTFNMMLIEIGQLMDQIQHVSAAIAHEFRLPLTRVRQRVERLAAVAAGNPEIAPSLQKMEAELDALMRSFDSMLQLAEIENTMPTNQTLIDLGDVVGHVSSAYGPEIEESGRPFTARLTSGIVRGDQQLISHAVANLLDNAIRHTPRGTPIEIGIDASQDGGPALFVIDRGPGIPADLRAAVLEKFRKLDPSRAKAGFGLGLAIVAAIVKRHNAALALSDAAPGLKVEIRFPVMRPASAVQAAE